MASLSGVNASDGRQPENRPGNVLVKCNGPGPPSQQSGAVFVSYASLPDWRSGATGGATRNQARRKSKQAMGFDPTTSSLGKLTPT
jgi:hypothetical protein